MLNHKVSFLMGIYNCESTLEAAIESILRQTYKNWELIMCDDGSSDNTYAVAKKYEEQYPDKIKVLRNEKNIRLAATLNRCAENATGYYVARMDGDDISIETRLEKQVCFLDNHPEYDLVGSYMQAFNSTGLKNEIAIKDRPQKEDLPKFNPFHHATIVMKKSTFNSLNGYHISKLTTRAEDVDLWFRFFKEGYKGYNLAEVLYLVREDDAAFRRRTFKHSLEASKVLYRGIKMLGLAPKYYIYVLKPIISQVTPVSVKRAFRKKMDKKNGR